MPEPILSPETLTQWQEIVDLIARLARVRACLIMHVVDEDIEVYVSSQTPNTPYTVGDRERLIDSGLYCERVIATGAPLHVVDAAQSPEWRDNPDHRHHNLLAYLGFPIRLSTGRRFGTLCLLDDRPYPDADDMTVLMERMRDLIESHLDLRERLWREQRHAQELQQAREAAEAANRAKSEFLSHMSHEIRTPLNIVLGMAQVLEFDPLNADQRQMVQRIRQAGQSLLAIINDILDLSRIEAGQLRIDSRPFELDALLAKLDSMMRHSAESHGLSLRIEMLVPDSLRLLIGDALRLEQVLMNLLANAIKFTERGEIQLRIAVIETLASASATRLRFEVRDTGIGIEPETLEQLFTPFTQADSSITRRFGGTGLGLAICKHLVELMGGTIGVESQVGRGSRFWFELTFDSPGAANRPKTPGVEQSMPATGMRLRGRHVLVVDDSGLNRDLLERALQRESAQVTLAADGQQAITYLKTHPNDFDAVLMDVRMPVMDGLTATRLIRTELRLVDLPIIALTAGTLVEDVEAARLAGVDDFLAKPLDLEQLVHCLLNQIAAR